MSPKKEIAGLLMELGARLVRAKKHRVYVLADGRRWVAGATCSDYRAQRNQLAQLRRLKAGRPAR